MPVVAYGISNHRAMPSTGFELKRIYLHLIRKTSGLPYYYAKNHGFFIVAHMVDVPFCENGK